MIFSGSDNFSIKESVTKFIRKLCGDSPEDNPALEIIRGDSDTEKYDALLDQLINSVTTPPFLTPEKIIWLRHFDKFDAAFAEPRFSSDNAFGIALLTWMQEEA